MQNYDNNKRVPIDIVSGFLGSGKTTLLNKLLKTHYKNLNIAVIENEFGDVDVDSALLPSDIEITKITGGCVCCTLKVSLIDGIKELINGFDLDRIVIETTGVAKLSDVVSAVNNKELAGFAFSANNIAVINPKFHNNLSSALGAYYHDQIKNANTIYISRKDLTDEDTLQETISSLDDINEGCSIITDVNELVLKHDTLHTVCDEHLGCNHHHHHHDEHHEHHHHHEDSTADFLNRFIDVEELSSFYELEALIQNIVEQEKPKTVYRIKGSVVIEGKNTLVQWVSGELNTSIIDFSENRLVIITSRK